MCKNRFYAEARKLDRSKSRIKSGRTTSKPLKIKFSTTNPLKSNVLASEILSSSSSSASDLTSEILSSSSSSSSFSSPYSMLLSSLGTSNTLTADQTLARFAFSTSSSSSSSSSATAISSTIITPPEVGSDNESLGDTAWLTCI